MEAYMAERKELYLGSILAAWIGLIDSAYLTWIKLTNNVAACGGIGDCDVVNNSRYAQIGPIPIALLGMGAFLLILALLYWEKRDPRSVEVSRYGVFLLALIGTLYSGYLTYVEVAILKAICPLCVLSALMLVVLLGLSAWRLNLYIQAT
jgi:uncharacterized membrane protein